MLDWLAPLRHTFFVKLVSLGLKAATIKGYVPAVDRLCAEVGRRGLTTPDDVMKAMSRARRLTENGRMHPAITVADSSRPIFTRVKRALIFNRRRG